MDKLVNGNAYQVMLLGDPNAGGALTPPPYELSLIAAAAATTTQTTPDQTNVGGRGVAVVLDVTAIGTGSVTLAIQGKDPASGKYYTLLAGAAVVANGTTVYSVYPGLVVAANVAANAVLPRTWRVVVTANNANPATYTVGASVLK